MRQILFLSVLLLLFLSSYAQSDTIKVDEAVSVVLEKELSAAGLKTGDTIFAFRVTDDVIVRREYGNITVVKKGAPVAAEVVLSMVPHRVKKHRMRRGDPDAFEERYIGDDYWSVGVLTIKLVSVQAVNGSFLALNECPMKKVGGTDGGYKNDKIPASIPEGTRKVCRTQYPTAVLVINR